jgi:hypothetical protein
VRHHPVGSQNEGRRNCSPDWKRMTMRSKTCPHWPRCARVAPSGSLEIQISSPTVIHLPEGPELGPQSEAASASTIANLSSAPIKVITPEKQEMDYAAAEFTKADASDGTGLMRQRQQLQSNCRQSLGFHLTPIRPPSRDSILTILGSLWSRLSHRPPSRIKFF